MNSDLIIKSMTWEQMQAKIEDDVAFYDLTFNEIVIAFGLHDLYLEGGHDVSITEKLNDITITFTRRY